MICETFFILQFEPVQAGTTPMTDCYGSLPRSWESHRDHSFGFCSRYCCFRVVMLIVTRVTSPFALILASSEPARFHPGRREHWRQHVSLSIQNEGDRPRGAQLGHPHLYSISKAFVTNSNCICITTTHAWRKLCVLPASELPISGRTAVFLEQSPHTFWEQGFTLKSVSISEIKPRIHIFDNDAFYW